MIDQKMANVILEQIRQSDNLMRRVNNFVSLGKYILFSIMVLLGLMIGVVLVFDVTPKILTVSLIGLLVGFLIWSMKIIKARKIWVDISKHYHLTHIEIQDMGGVSNAIQNVVGLVLLKSKDDDSVIGVYDHQEFFDKDSLVDLSLWEERVVQFYRTVYFSFKNTQNYDVNVHLDVTFVDELNNAIQYYRQDVDLIAEWSRFMSGVKKAIQERVFMFELNESLCFDDDNLQLVEDDIQKFNEQQSYFQVTGVFLNTEEKIPHEHKLSLVS